MLTYILGPFVSILPRRWRELLPFSMSVQWKPATAISGLSESVLALIALSYWYSYAMTAWVGRAVDSALEGKSGPGVTPQQIGTVALAVWATHPLTLFLGYLGLEGAIRLCAAAFSGNILGIFPLFLFDKVFVAPFRRLGPKNRNAADDEWCVTRKAITGSRQTHLGQRRGHSITCCADCPQECRDAPCCCTRLQMRSSNMQVEFADCSVRLTPLWVRREFCPLRLSRGLLDELHALFNLCGFLRFPEPTERLCLAGQRGQ